MKPNLRKALLHVIMCARGRVRFGLFAAFVLAGCRAATPSAPDAAGAEEAAPVSVLLGKASRRDVAVTVEAQGTLTPAQGSVARLASSVAARVLTVTVKEGDRVRAGQVVATLDTRALSAQARGAQSAYQASMSQARQAQLAADASQRDQQSSVQVARLALRASLTDRAANLQNAQTALDLARNDLARLQAGARPQEIAQARESLAQADATRKRAETELTRQTFLFERGISAQRQVDDAQTGLAVAVAAAESARENSILVQAGARAEERDAARLRVRQASEALTQAQTTGDAKVAQARAALRQASGAAFTVAAQVQGARAAQDAVAKSASDVQAAQVQAEAGVVRAPYAGVVSRRALNPGDLADPATPLVEITQGDLDLVASLPSEEGDSVRAGQRASIQVDAIRASAVVLSVGQVDPQTNLLPVRLRIVGGRERFKVGAFAAAQITTAVHRRAVVVAKPVVITRDGVPSVFTVDGKSVAHLRAVKTGVEGDTVEIVSGLKAGETVVRQGQYELADGAKVRNADAANAAKAEGNAAP